jgi:glutathione synthase/RimK-type ligase-like ATP-grasp enzyme
MSADDIELHFNADELTPKQTEEFESLKDLMGFLQAALIGIGKPGDHLMLYDAFSQSSWPERLKRLAGFFKSMGLETIPPEHWHYHPKDGFYESVAKDIPGTETFTLYLTSGSNKVIHDNPEMLKISRELNSKVFFAQHAPKFGIPVPETLVTTKRDLGSIEVAEFLVKHGNQVMLKILGLSGARNVTVVTSQTDCIDYVEEFPDDLDVVLQERLDLERFTEMTVDLRITPNDISIANVRKIMFSEGLWVGNLLGPEVVLTGAHEEVLIKVGEFARAHGFVLPEGINCGIDYFVDGEDIVVIEINARWTGGLFPTEIIKMAGATQETAVAFVDLVAAPMFDTYLDFIDAHLFSKSAETFAVIPNGFSAIPQMIDGQEFFFGWQTITGDFESFKAAREKQLGDGVLMRAETISLSL